MRDPCNRRRSLRSTVERARPAYHVTQDKAEYGPITRSSPRLAEDVFAVIV